MTNMGAQQQWRRWLGLGTVLVVVFVAAVSMHMERLRGWGFFVLCFVVGSIGGLGFVLVKRRVQTAWNGLHRKQQTLIVVAAIAVVLLTSFLWNYGTPDATFNDFVTVGGTIVALLLWGLYRLFSRLLDAIWARFINR
jgi:hypothetical protein